MYDLRHTPKREKDKMTEGLVSCGCLVFALIGAILAFAGLACLEAWLFWLLWANVAVPNFHWFSLEYWECVVIFTLFNLFFSGSVGAVTRS